MNTKIEDIDPCQCVCALCDDLTFRGPWIVIYSYYKTKEMH